MPNPLLSIFHALRVGDNKLEEFHYEPVFSWQDLSYLDLTAFLCGSRTVGREGEWLGR